MSETGSKDSKRSPANEPHTSQATAAPVRIDWPYGGSGSALGMGLLCIGVALLGLSGWQFFVAFAQSTGAFPWTWAVAMFLSFATVVWTLTFTRIEQKKAAAQLQTLLFRTRQLARIDHSHPVALPTQLRDFQKNIDKVEGDWQALQEQLAAVATGQNIRSFEGFPERHPEFDVLIHQLHDRLNAASDTLVEWKALMECIESVAHVPENEGMSAASKALHAYFNAFESLLYINSGDKLQSRWKIDFQLGEVWFRNELDSNKETERRFHELANSSETLTYQAVHFEALWFSRPALQVKDLHVVSMAIHLDGICVGILLFLVPAHQMERVRTMGRMLHALLSQRLMGIALHQQLSKIRLEFEQTQKQFNLEKDRAFQLEIKLEESDEQAQNLEHQQQQYVSILNQRVAYVSLNDTLGFIHVSTAAEQLLGMKSNALLGFQLSDCFEPEESNKQPKVETILKSVKEKGFFRCELYLKQATGKKLMGLLFSAPLVPSNEVRFSMQLFDLSDQDFLAAELRLLIENLSDKEQEVYHINSLLESAQGNVFHLRNSLNNLSKALNRSAIVAETDTIGRIITANDHFLRTCRYSREEIIGQNHRILKSGHQSDELFENLWKTIITGNAWTGEIKNRTKDGSYYWISTTITPILNVNGKYDRFISVSFDITLRKLHEEQLLSAIELSRNQETELIQNAGDLREVQLLLREVQLDLRGKNEALRNSTLFSETDLRGTITFANVAFAKAAGMASNDLKGKNHRVLKSDEHDDAFYFNLWKIIVGGEVWRGRIRNRAADGRLYWLETCITPVLSFDQQPIRYIGVSYEITEPLQWSVDLAQLTEEHRKQEHKFMTASYELSGQTQALQQAGIFAEVDHEGIIRQANDRLLILSRMARNELCGQPFSRFFDSEDADFKMPSFWSKIGDEEQPWTGEVKLIPDGETEPVWLQGHLSSVPDGKGRPRYVLCLFQDVSLLKEREEHISILRTELVQLKSEWEESQHKSHLPDEFPVALFRKDVQGQRLIWVSAYVLQLTGFTALDWLSDTSPWPDMLHPEDRILVLDALKQAARQQNAYQIAYRWQTKDRDWRTIREEGRPAFDEQGQLTHFDGLWIDLSSEYKVQSEWKEQASVFELKNSESDLKINSLSDQNLLLHSTNEAMLQVALVFETTPEGQISEVNNALLSRSGLLYHQLYGKNIANLISSRHSTVFISDIIQTIQSGKVWKGSLQLQEANGNDFWCRLTATPVLGPDHMPFRFVFVAQDIHKEKEQEKVLRQLYETSRAREQELYTVTDEMEKIQRMILDNQVSLYNQVNALNNAALVSETDATGRISYVNDLALHTWGYTFEEAIGRKHNLISSDYHGRPFFAQMWRTLAVGRVWRGQVLNRNRQGVPFWVQLTITPVLGSEAYPESFIGVAFDITERVRQTVQLTSGPDARQLAEERNRIQQLLHRIGQMEAKQEAYSGTDNLSQLPVAAAELDDRWRFVRLNSAFEQQVHWSEEQLAGANIAQLLHTQQDSGITLDSLSQTLDSGQWAYSVLTIVDKERNTHRIAAAFASQQGVDGKGKRIWMFAFDLGWNVFSQAQKETPSTFSERMLERLTANTLYFEMDTDGNFTYLHDRMLQVLGKQPDDLISKPFPVISSRRTPVSVFEGLIEQLNRGRTWYGSMEWVLTDHALLKVLGAMAPVIRSDGQIDRIVGLFIEYERFDTSTLSLEPDIESSTNPKSKDKIGSVKSGRSIRSKDKN